jgi:DNA (cytosine-5)-methyltransferase 1
VTAPTSTAAKLKGAEFKAAEFKAAEFFAGIGLVRLGLEAAGVAVAWATDIDAMKRSVYQENFGGPGEFLLADIADVRGADVPDVDLATASFPCVDLSLAGWRRGLAGAHSGTFWHFTRVLDEMGERRPPVVLLENVVGFATSRGGLDLRAAAADLNRLGYSVDAIVLDARRFVPQSRPRLFVVGAQTTPAPPADGDDPLRPALLGGALDHAGLRTHTFALPPPPELMSAGLGERVEPLAESDSRWWDDARARQLVASLSPVQQRRFASLRDAAQTSWRTAYRRTRNGRAVWEIRSDDVAGCLRTARGGSSRQALLRLGAGNARVRWLTPRECARLMGVPERYTFNSVTKNQALFGFGDAVCVPGVTWIARHYLLALLSSRAVTVGSLGRSPRGSRTALVSA